MSDIDRADTARKPETIRRESAIIPSFFTGSPRPRDELSDMRQELIAEIRLAPEADHPPDFPAPSLTSIPQGGGHEDE